MKAKDKKTTSVSNPPKRASRARSGNEEAKDQQMREAYTKQLKTVKDGEGYTYMERLERTINEFRACMNHPATGHDMALLLRGILQDIPGRLREASEYFEQRRSSKKTETRRA